jgi:tetrahydromethanopterin S-methyltransferase subunit C
MATETFFTADSFGTVAGCAAAIIIASNTIRKLTRLTTPLVPFVISLVIGFVVAGGLAGKLNGPMEWLLAFLNSCLLFCTATGGQEIAATAGQAQQPGGVTRQSATPVSFFSSWLRR